MEVRPPTSPSEADALTHSIVSRWDQGGNIQMQDLLSQSFDLLFTSLLRHHVLSPKLSDSAFTSLLRDSQRTDEVLDLIWSIDAELDTRNEISGEDEDVSLGAAQGTKVTMATARTRLGSLVKKLIAQGILPRDLVCERLEQGILVAAGLITDERYFQKRTVQLRTARFFKQQKFNLLREENEGYSALVTEIMRGIGPPIVAVRAPEPGTQGMNEPDHIDSPVLVVEQESPAERNSRAARIMNNIQALIGYFDLDANRVLDIVLDVFSNNVVYHYPFFLALLAASSWGKDRTTEKGKARENGMGIDDAQTPARFGSIDVNITNERGNKTCAHVLGFKFAHYCSQEIKETAPEELYYTAALLVKEGYVRFSDLFSHLSPGEAGMLKLHGQYKKALTEKVSSARTNALSMAAPLTDESASSSAKKDGDKNAATTELKEPPNQILGILKAFLGLGNLKHSLFILTRWPWLGGAYPEVADSYIRILKHAIKPAYDEISFSRMSPVISNPSIATPKMRYNAKQQKMVYPQKRVLVLTKQVPEPLPTFAQRQVFFYDAWSSELPHCTSSQHILHTFIPLLKVLGVHLWRDAGLLQRLCRLTKVGLKLAIGANDDSIRSQWLDVLRYHLLPALSLSPSNSGLVNEIWMLVRILSYQDRFGLYGQWKTDLYRLAELRAVQASTEKEAKGILKRISKDNVKLSGRNLAKASHSNPTVFFTVALNQVQAYDNLILPLVESAKYLSHFEYDIFSYNLVDALSNPEKERTKQDGTNISLWLKSLASFCGTLFKRYAMMDCTPILQYLVNQLKANNSKDLVIVTELIMKMSGIEPLANLADGQVAALTGGRILRMEAMMAANAVSGSKERTGYRRSGIRLLQALTDSKLAIPLLILIAQQRQACIHLVPDDEAHLKYLGNLYDSSQEVLLQYVEFLHNHLEPSEYTALVPSLEALCCRFGIEPAMSFHIARPKMTHSIKMMQAEATEKKLRAELTASKNKAAATKKNGEQVPANGEASEDIEMTDAVAVQEEPSLVQVEEKQSPWHPGLVSSISAAQLMLPARAHSTLGAPFYCTFWQLCLADISVPSERYQQETIRLTALSRTCTNEEQRKKFSDLVLSLNTEMRDQIKSHEIIRKRLQMEKTHWFSDRVDRETIASQLIQHCLFPRALLSATDAIFAGKFIKSMHSLGTRNFSSLTAYDKVFTEHIGPTIFSSTENEARNYSRFLFTVLSDLSPWYRTCETFKREALGTNLPGFQMRWSDRHGGEEIPSEDLMKWEQFRQIYGKWMECLQTAFKACLVGGEYMRIRNAIVVMTRIAPFYPQSEGHGVEMLSVVEELGRKEERGDLKVLATGLLATLKARRKDWIGTTLLKPTPPPLAAAVVEKPKAALPIKPAVPERKPSRVEERKPAAEERKSTPTVPRSDERKPPIAPRVEERRRRPEEGRRGTQAERVVSRGEERRSSAPGTPRAVEERRPVEDRKPIEEKDRRPVERKPVEEKRPAEERERDQRPTEPRGDRPIQDRRLTQDRRDEKRTREDRREDDRPPSSRDRTPTTTSRRRDRREAEIPTGPRRHRRSPSPKRSLADRLTSEDAKRVKINRSDKYADRSARRAGTNA